METLLERCEMTRKACHEKFIFSLIEIPSSAACDMLHHRARMMTEY